MIRASLALVLSTVTLTLALGCTRKPSECAELLKVADAPVDTTPKVVASGATFSALGESTKAIDKTIASLGEQKLRTKPVLAGSIGYRDALAVVRQKNLAVDAELARIDMGGNAEHAAILAREITVVAPHAIALGACLFERSDECLGLRGLLETWSHPAKDASVQAHVDAGVTALEALSFTSPELKAAASGLAAGARRMAPALASVKANAEEAFALAKRISDAVETQRRATEKAHERVLAIRAVCAAPTQKR